VHASFPLPCNPARVAVKKRREIAKSHSAGWRRSTKIYARSGASSSGEGNSPGSGQYHVKGAGNIVSGRWGERNPAAAASTRRNAIREHIHRRATPARRSGMKTSKAYAESIPFPNGLVSKDPSGMSTRSASTDPVSAAKMTRLVLSPRVQYHSEQNVPQEVAESMHMK